MESKVKNERGAGRRPNHWSSRQMTIPDPIREHIKGIVNDWIKEQKKDDLMSRRFYGVGFFGIGPFNCGENGLHTNAYSCWKRMLERCYSEYADDKYSSYKDVVVCDEWHNFQNFAKWYYENYPQDGAKYHLDKDIKVPGNRIYSPDACMFVSERDNCSHAQERRMYRFTVVDENGNEFDGFNQRDFCEERGIGIQNFNAMLNGKLKSAYGFKLKWREYRD
ncbi:HNH endonuclease [Vibrio phage NF]|uniref:DNA-binding domain protein n=1 Tax=Vibrio phage NF TaxID=2686202 RepID=A0A6B9J0J8_9CAUD|nr:HNH endonuclease [Vibrio phage NF]QGZ13243.1 DNA-binding domain protein [Vibrio phage NF]